MNSINSKPNQISCGIFRQYKLINTFSLQIYRTMLYKVESRVSVVVFFFILSAKIDRDNFDHRSPSLHRILDLSISRYKEIPVRHVRCAKEINCKISSDIDA